jgi:hypothetical protein
LHQGIGRVGAGAHDLAPLVDAERPVGLGRQGAQVLHDPALEYEGAVASTGMAELAPAGDLALGVDVHGEAVVAMPPAAPLRVRGNYCRDSQVGEPVTSGVSRGGCRAETVVGVRYRSAAHRWDPP